MSLAGASCTPNLSDLPRDSDSDWQCPWHCGDCLGSLPLAPRFRGVWYSRVRLAGCGAGAHRPFGRSQLSLASGQWRLGVSDARRQCLGLAAAVQLTTMQPRLPVPGAALASNSEAPDLRLEAGQARVAGGLPVTVRRLPVAAVTSSPRLKLVASLAGSGRAGTASGSGRGRRLRAHAGPHAGSNLTARIGKRQRLHSRLQPPRYKPGL